MSRYASGRRAEYLCQEILAEEGYAISSRAASSKGPFDVYAFLTEFEEGGKPLVRFIQVKKGNKPGKREREKLEAITVPPLSTRELWWFPKGSSKPVVTLV